jgi:hypothetical protein
MIDLFLVYKFIRRLAEPFIKWDAFKEGIIDKNGNILISRKKLKTRKQKDAFGVFDLMILNLKKLLSKVPGGQSKLASYASALWLIREWNHFTNGTLLTEEVTDKQIEESVTIFNNRYGNYITDQKNVNSFFDLNEKKYIEEEPVVNNVGSGNIAGVDPDGEPVFTKIQQHKYRKKNLKDLMSRK